MVYRVAYATGSRADYGIVRRYLKKLDNDVQIDFSLLVTGSHLEEKFGMSINNIISDGFRIDFQAKLDIDNSNNAGILQSMSCALNAFGTFFENHKYDLLIILGDRYEMMAVAVAAAIQRIPILHLHGGEVTYGNYDEFIRHCITKMSTYHFTSTLTYRNRVIQLGEDPNSVFYLGALGAENCRNIDEELVKEWVKKMPTKQYFVVAFHPETLTNVSLIDQVNEILTALDSIVNQYEVVLIGSNADTYSGVIREAWKKYTQINSSVRYIENLNVDSYLYLLKNSIALIGNSSSGIIEAPSLETLSINIGDRQAGRVAGDSVISIACNCEQIKEAIGFAICNKGKKYNNPYYLYDTVEQYYEQTKKLLNAPSIMPKMFYDIDFFIK